MTQEPKNDASTHGYATEDGGPPRPTVLERGERLAEQPMPKRNLPHVTQEAYDRAFAEWVREFTAWKREMEAWRAKHGTKQ